MGKDNKIVYFDDIIWNRLPLHNFLGNSQMKTINNFLKQSQENMAHGYSSHELNICIRSGGFKDFNVRIKFSELNDNIKGLYNPNTQIIYLNKNKFLKKEENSGRDLHYVLPHELTHAFQDYMLKNENELVKQYGSELSNYLKLMHIARDGYADVGYLNIKGKNNNDGYLHIDSYTSSTRVSFTAIDDISAMFYALSITEAEAFYIGEQKGNDFVDFINNHPNGNICRKDSKYNLTSKALLDFNNRYAEDVDYSNKDIFNMVNKCMVKIYEHKQPENDIEASVMYDICCLALLMNQNIDEIDCNNYLKAEVKSKNLYEYGFAVPGEHTRYGDYIIKPDINHEQFQEYISDISKVDNLSEEQKKNNPELLIWLAFIYGDNLKNRITDKEPIKQYCIGNRDKFVKSEQYMARIEYLLGNDFATILKEMVINDTNIQKESEQEDMYREINGNITKNTDDYPIHGCETYIVEEDAEL